MQNKPIGGGSTVMWRCPRCRGDLRELDEGLRCAACAARYECISGIPDLRVPGPSWIDYAKDSADARRLATETVGMNVEQIVRRVYSMRPGWDEARIALRTRQVVAAPDRLRADLDGWLRPVLREHGQFLDLGCGPGMLLAAAAGRQGIGIDVSMVWLVVAQRLIEAWGGRPVLAAAQAEALPLADGVVSGVVSLDVIEHVADPARYLGEIDRVMAPGGRVALSTPNRFSLAAEPHVSVWGVGWLPRRLQKRYVRWRCGDSYEFTRLLSTREAGGLIRRHTNLRFKLVVPPVPHEEIRHFPAYRAFAAKLYNRMSRAGWTRPLFLAIGPFFRVVGIKEPAVEQGSARTERVMQ